MSMKAYEEFLARKNEYDEKDMELVIAVIKRTAEQMELQKCGWMEIQFENKSEKHAFEYVRSEQLKFNAQQYALLSFGLDIHFDDYALENPEVLAESK